MKCCSERVFCDVAVCAASRMCTFRLTLLGGAGRHNISEGNVRGGRLTQGEPVARAEVTCNDQGCNASQRSSQKPAGGASFCQDTQTDLAVHKVQHLCAVIVQRAQALPQRQMISLELLNIDVQST